MPPTHGPSPFYRLAWGFYLVLAVAGLVWLGARTGLPWELFWSADGWAVDIALGLGSGLGLVGLWRLGRRFLAPLRALEEALREVMTGVDPGEVLTLAVISGVAEELFFRGAMQGSWGPIWATLVFGLVHTGPGRTFRLWTVFALLAGGLFAWLTVLRGNLLPAIVGHVVVNAVNLRSLVPAPEPAPTS